MGWGAAIGGLVGLYGANQQKKAASAQQQAGKDALALQQQMWQQQQANLGPYMQYGAGAGGLGGLSSLMAGDYSGFENSPDYIYARDEMRDGIDASAANVGRLYSGGQNLDLARHLNGLASQNLGNYRSALMWGANLGQNAAAGVGQAGQQYANAAGGLMGNIADAKGTGYGANAAMASGLGGLLQGVFANNSQPQSSYGIPGPVDPYANTNYGQSGWFS